MKLLIGIHGPKESGKDTHSKLLRNWLLGYKYYAEIDRFAATIYAMSAQVDPVFSPQMTHRDKEAYVLGKPELGTRRNFLEKLGTEFGRDMINPMIWTSTTMRRVADTQRTVILADVRTQNEQDAILAHNGIIVHLEPDWILPTPGEHHFTASKLSVVDSTREVIIPLTQGHINADQAKIRRAVDSLRLNGVGLYVGLETD